MFIQAATAIQTPAPPPAPATPTPAPAVATPSAVTPLPVQTGPTRPITQAEISRIRQQRGEMSDQLQSAQNRREEILEALQGAPPGTEQGLRDQYQVLSDRIVRIEQDLEISGQTLRTGQVPEGTVIIPPRDFTPGRTDDIERGASIGMAFLLVIVGLTIARRIRRRRNGGDNQRTVVYDERMERLEQAVDAIAIEIERVGEAQRFQTKVLAEANLMPAMSNSRAADPVHARDYDHDR